MVHVSFLYGDPESSCTRSGFSVRSFIPPDGVASKVIPGWTGGPFAGTYLGSSSSQQPVHQFFVSLGGILLLEFKDLLAARRQAKQAEVEPSNQGGRAASPAGFSPLPSSCVSRKPSIASCPHAGLGSFGTGGRTGWTRDQCLTRLQRCASRTRVSDPSFDLLYFAGRQFLARRHLWLDGAS